MCYCCKLKATTNYHRLIRKDQGSNRIYIKNQMGYKYINSNRGSRLDEDTNTCIFVFTAL